MYTTNIIREVEIERTPRVRQVEGLFDLSASKVSRQEWDVDIELPDDWNIGVIVGPSGAGKTTVAKELFGANISNGFNWSDSKSIIDGFPRDLPIKEITGVLSSVGFSSPPSWLKPYHVLSNGEKFRVDVARTMLETGNLAVIDEFTSVVDRNVAKIGSHAIQRTIRRMNKRLIAVTCHYDVLEWLEPDWYYEPHTNKFHSGRYLRRPEIKLEISRVNRRAWEIFRKHHYLNTSIHMAAQCFIALWENEPVAFASFLSWPGKRGKVDNRFTKREHRTVCLPDYQGVGIGNALSDFVASVVTANGFKYLSQTSHPAMVMSRAKSKNWTFSSKPSFKGSVIPKKGMVDNNNGDFDKERKKIRSRFLSSFKYVGKPYPDKEFAVNMFNDKPK